jgi:hypothetical protein
LSHHVKGSWSALLLHDLQVAAAATHRTLQEAGWFCVLACRLVALQQQQQQQHFSSRSSSSGQDCSFYCAAAAGRTAASAIAEAISGAQQHVWWAAAATGPDCGHNMLAQQRQGHCINCTGFCLFDSLLIKLRSQIIS